MQNEILLVTGSNGFIGQALIAGASAHYRVFALDRILPAKVSPPGIHSILCDLTSEASVQEALTEVARVGGARIAAVVHLAADLELTEPAPSSAEPSSVTATRILLRGLRGFTVEQFIFASTMLVHVPSRPGVRINENAPVAPKWSFPQAKLAAERTVREEAAGIPVVNLRLAAVYDDHCHSLALSQQIERIRDKRMTARHFPGNPRHGQSYLHVDDVVDAILRSVQRRRDLPTVTTLLLGEPDTVSYDGLQRRIGWLLHGMEWKTHRVSKRLAQTTLWLQHRISDVDPFVKPWMLKVADHHYELDTSRAEQTLGWKPGHALLDVLPRMIEHLRSDPVAWERDNRLSA